MARSYPASFPPAYRIITLPGSNPFKPIWVLTLPLFDNRITLTADIYRILKKDLLLNVTLPGASGFGSSTQNIGEVENKGIEFGTEYR